MPVDPNALSALQQHILQAQSKVRQEMPDVADAPIAPMGWLDQLVADTKGKMQGGITMALTHPGATGSVALNLKGLQEAGVNQNDLEDTLAHELTHVRQGRDRMANKGFIDQVKETLSSMMQGHLPYGQQPDELEAFQVEGDRAVRQGRAPGVTPNFSSAGYREKGDYYLRPEKK